jgi:hypothetical protein
MESYSIPIRMRKRPRGKRSSQRRRFQANLDGLEVEYVRMMEVERAAKTSDQTKFDYERLNACEVAL